MPNIFLITAIDEALVAGPAIKNINAAPGVMPLAISTTAIGIDAVAQTYIGSDTASIIVYWIKLLEEKCSAINWGGIKIAIAAATTSPCVRGIAISAGKVKNPYLTPEMILLFYFYYLLNH